MISNSKSMSESFENLNNLTYNDTYSESSISFTQNLSELLIKNNSVLPPPVNIYASFSESNLKINVDCSRVQKDPFAYIRHCLICEITPQSLFSVKEFLTQYFKNIEIGDFFRVIPISSVWEPTNWIEKTKNSCLDFGKILQIPKINNTFNLPSILSKTLKHNKGCSNLIGVSILLESPPSPCLLSQIDGMKSLLEYTCDLRIFCLSGNPPLQKPILNENLVKHITNIPSDVLSIVNRLKEVVLISLTINLECLNGVLFNTHQVDKYWEFQGNKLKRNLKMLTSKCVYLQELKIHNLKVDLDLKVEVILVSMRGDSYKTSGWLKIAKEGSQSKEIQTTPCSRLVDCQMIAYDSDDDDGHSVKSLSLAVVRNTQEISFINAHDKKEDM